MRGRRVEVVVAFLDVFAVIAFAVRQTEQTLLEDRIARVPHREAEAQSLLIVAESGDAVFAPTIGAAARMIVGEVVPGIAMRAVVLPHRAPLPLGQVRPPSLPSSIGCRQPHMFCNRFLHLSALTVDRMLARD